jgi:hypothetical protein
MAGTFMDQPDDLYRYIEYLQRTIHSQGWESFHDLYLMRAWFETNSAKFDVNLAPQYNNIGSPTAHLEKLIHDFQPKTSFDSPFTEAIFSPLLAQVRLAAERLGIKSTRKIHIATSTNVAASPMILPTDASHFLFIGLGASSFCNYWAKAFTAVVRSIPISDPPKRISSVEDLRAGFKTDPGPLIFALRLALAYANYGSVLGFGEIIQPPSYLAYRGQILNAMEIFIVAHEFAHVVAAERIPKFQGSLEPNVAQDLEIYCDEMALAVSRAWANENDNDLAFAGIGALLFFRAIELSESVRDKLVDILQMPAPSESLPVAGPRARLSHHASSHPSLSTRISAIKSLAISCTEVDQRTDLAAFTEEYDRIAAVCLFWYWNHLAKGINRQTMLGSRSLPPEPESITPLIELCDRLDSRR